MYKAQRFESIFYLEKFLNENKINRQDIIGIYRNDKGLMELLYVKSEAEESGKE